MDPEKPIPQDAKLTQQDKLEESSANSRPTLLTRRKSLAWGLGAIGAAIGGLFAADKKLQNEAVNPPSPQKTAEKLKDPVIGFSERHIQGGVEEAKK